MRSKTTFGTTKKQKIWRVQLPRRNTQSSAPARAHTSTQSVPLTLNNWTHVWINWPSTPRKPSRSPQGQTPPPPSGRPSTNTKSPSQRATRTLPTPPPLPLRNCSQCVHASPGGLTRTSGSLSASCAWTNWPSRTSPAKRNSSWRTRGWPWFSKELVPRGSSYGCPMSWNKRTSNAKTALHSTTTKKRYVGHVILKGNLFF